MTAPRRGTSSPSRQPSSTRRALPNSTGPSRREVVHRLTGRLLTLLCCTAVMGGLGSAAGLGASLSKLPDVSILQHFVPHETSKIFDCRGRLIANVHGEENRVVIPLQDIPRFVQNAVIATEDTDFYQHYGVNPKGITRALLVNMAEGGSVEGASTLTQQLAKNLFLEPAKTLPRKIAEAWLAIQIEHHYSKAQILEMYLNQVYWGHNAYGIEAAAQNYFGKSSRQLSLAESAMLAGILRGPELYSPYHNPKGARHLQKLVLDRMALAGFITPQQARDAERQPLKHPGVTSYAYKAPYFTSWLIAQLITKYGEEKVLKGGMRIYTTLDLDLQQQAEAMVKEAVAKSALYNIHQGALVAIEPKTGYVRVLVGGADFAKSKFNRAVQAYRPPGSTFKPFVYLAALSGRFSPSSVVVDEPISLPSGSGEWYSPQNYDRRFRGPITLRRALENSVNIVAVKLALEVGVGRVIEVAQALGIKSKLGHNLSLPLGTSEVTPYEMASAYGVLAADGLRCEPALVTKILDRGGKPLEVHQPKPKRAWDAEPVRLLVNMMEGVIHYGTGVGANIGRPAAGKTGTTSDARDVWFSGFTPDLATTVWMGNDDNSRLTYSATGGGVCAPLWSRFMRYALKNHKPRAFVGPTSARAAPPLRPGRMPEGMENLDVMQPEPPPPPRERPRPLVRRKAPIARPVPTKPPVVTTDETLLEPEPDFP